MNSHVKTEHTEIWLHDGIIYTVHAPCLKKITLEIARESVRKRLLISNGKSYPMLFDGTNIVSIDEEARAYLSGEEAVRYLNAGAFLVNNPIQRIVATTFILLNRPPVPMKLFTVRDKAIEWLQCYKNLN